MSWKSVNKGLEYWKAECEDPEAGEEPTHQPSVAILAQAQQGGCPIGPPDPHRIIAFITQDAPVLLVRHGVCASCSTDAMAALRKLQ